MKKIVMITGATAGFGRAAAKKFAENGFDIIITGRRKERLEQLEKELFQTGAKVLPLNFDVRKRKEVESSISILKNEWKNIDILINNAGLASGYSHVDDGDPDDWDKMIDTNVKGLLYVTRAVVPLMVERGGGHIINISSIAATDIYEYGNVYCASKSAVNTLSRAMRIDLVKHNIKVTNVAPGMAETEFSIVRFKGNEERANAVYKGMDAMTAEDIAEVIFYCVSLPPHFCINNIEISPTRQASVIYVNRKS
jgi:NADP-dependent 3-hydroxy acid dehydrogenase YdfG